ncbi:MAG: DNA polymerase III subunit beta, partial [Rhizobium rhizophilum]
MFKASKASLKSALALSGDIVERRNTIPILSNLLIERASKHELEVRMTDLDVEGRILFEADVDESFQPFTVPA